MAVQFAAVDGSNLLYKMLPTTTENVAMFGGNCADELARVTHDWVRRKERFLHQRIILVRDGNPPVAKATELAERKEKKRKAREEDERQAAEVIQAVAAASPEQANLVEAALSRAVRQVDSGAQVASVAEAIGVLPKEAQEAALGVVRQVARHVRLTRSLRQQVYARLEAWGNWVFQAPCEAEAQAAQWMNEGRANLVVSNDFDALLFGSERIAFDFWDLQRTKELSHEIWRIGASSREELVEAHIVAGRSGYAPGLKLTREEGMQMLDTHGGFDAYLATLPLLRAELLRGAKKSYLEPVVCRCTWGSVCKCEATKKSL